MAKTIRIQKYLGDGGILSRRKTEEYIKAGRITVNGRPAAPGHPVAPGDVIAIDGQRAGKNVLCEKPASGSGWSGTRKIFT